jgi:hypothetical protein
MVFLTQSVTEAPVEDVITRVLSKATRSWDVVPDIGGGFRLTHRGTALNIDGEETEDETQSKEVFAVGHLGQPCCLVEL